MSINLSLRQNLELRQELALIQKMELSRLMSVPDAVLNFVAGSVAHNPEAVEAKLQEIKESNKGLALAGKKAQTLYASLLPSIENYEDRLGIIGTPDIRSLEGIIGNRDLVETPDVTYIGREHQKPEIVFSDHLKGSMNLRMLMVDPNKYPETAKLFYQLKNFDEWKRGKLINVYLNIGDKQREYFENFNPLRFNLFSQNGLAESMGLSESTVSRLLSNRFVEARNIEREQKFLRSKDLLKTKDNIKRYRASSEINKILDEEFSAEVAYSDEGIANSIPNISRRAITKYRNEAGIPSARKRKDIYKTKVIKEPYKIDIE